MKRLLALPMAAVMVALFITPAQAADAHSIIVARTGSDAARATSTQSAGGLSVGVGRARAGSALTSFAQTTSTSVRMMATLTNASQSTVDYSLGLPPGAELLPEADGSLTISRAVVGAPNPTIGTVTQQLGTIAAPWAVDANGTSLPTSYTYAGGVLTQRIDLTGAAYPVVADPRLTIGFFEYVHFSRAETLDLYHAWQISGTPTEISKFCGAFALLGAVGIVVGFGCYAYVALIIQDINTTLWYAAHNYNRGLVVKFFLGAFLYAGSTTEYAV